MRGGRAMCTRRSRRPSPAEGKLHRQGAAHHSEGWRKIDRIFRASLKEKPEDEAEPAALPDFTEGQTFDQVEAAVTEHFTTPPKAYTEDTLLSAMENAGKEDMPDEAERKGLGTPATRAAIIEKLVSGGFVECKGKN